MGKVISLNVSDIRGIEKNSVPSVNAIVGWGIEGDGHGGDWDKQVSVFPIEAMAKVPLDKKEMVDMAGYTENITIQGIPLEDLGIGTVLKVGEAVIEVLYIGKEEYKEYGRPYIVSREGRFGIIKKGGKINVGDAVQVIK